MSKTGAQTGVAKWGLIAGALLALAGCARLPVASVPEAERNVIAGSLMRDINVLASDEYGGRFPGTEGGQQTVNYIIQQLNDAGLESGTNDPGNPWRAPVRLISTRPSESKITLSFGAREVELSPEISAAYTSRQLALVEGADVVFVGREAETVAAEAIAGKVVLMLGEPGVSPERRETLFALNPAAIVTVVEDRAAIANLRTAFDREQLLLASDETTELSAFVTSGTMVGAMGEARWDELLEEAERDDFEPIDLTVSATIEAKSQRRVFNSYNVIGRLPGQVPGSGAIMLMAHWDHLGLCGPEGASDLICNGAIDNASGVAVMLELARRLKASGPHDRDIYVMATTAEESGLLGIKAFVDAPSLPLETIVASFNFDTVAVAPAGSPVGFVGEGRTPLDPIIRQVMRDAKRELGNRALAESFIQRQDAWTLLQRDVPAVVLSTAFGSEITLGPYLEEHYHKASDEVTIIELGGAIDDLLLHEELVKRIADTAVYSAP